jgi:cell division protein FtsQ
VAPGTGIPRVEAPNDRGRPATGSPPRPRPGGYRPSPPSNHRGEQVSERTRLPIEPRIKQRRIELQRASGRRRLRHIFAAAGLAMSVGAALAVLHSPLLRVRHLQVSGANHLGLAEVSRVSKVGPRTPMVDVKASKVEASLERLPWIRSVVVHRHWPGTVTVAVVERTPVAQIRAVAGGWAEVDASGKVLDQAQSSWAGLVTLVGFGTAGQPGSTLPGARAGLDVGSAIPRSILPQVSEVLSDPGGKTSLELTGSVTVSLGAPTQLKAKMSALATMLAQVNMTAVRTIDLEVPEAPTLTRD